MKSTGFRSCYFKDLSVETIVVVLAVVYILVGLLIYIPWRDYQT